MINFSLFYAKFIGLYFIIVAICMLINPSSMKIFLKDVLENKTVVMFTGLMSLLFGLVIVLTNNIWMGWPIIITIIGYLSIIRGIVRLLYPDWFIQMASKNFLQNKSYYLIMIILLILGIILLCLGFFGV